MEDIPPVSIHGTVSWLLSKLHVLHIQLFTYILVENKRGCTHATWKRENRVKRRDYWEGKVRFIPSFSIRFFNWCCLCKKYYYFFFYFRVICLNKLNIGIIDRGWTFSSLYLNMPCCLQFKSIFKLFVWFQSNFKILNDPRSPTCIVIKTNLRKQE